ncbi:Mobile element protein [Vibrio vulnificus]|nr:Mobile element protein [Vibrio vulnificus]
MLENLITRHYSALNHWCTGLEVYGGGEWKVKKHGTAGKLRAWRKPHLAVDTDTHEIITV